MATDEDALEQQEPNGDEWEDDDLEISDDIDDIEDLEDLDDDLDEDDSAEGDDAEGGDDGEEDGEPLDELEAEELEMLTEDEAAESLPVDEAEELRAIRRATMSLESSADSAGDDEFVCQSCYLVKAGSQLVDKRKMLCRDCA